jgi:UDP-2,3-diacylglucosamine pyrophosphatase LpxH
MHVLDVPPGAFASENHRYRTVWISDVHLGTRGSQANELLRFLKAVDFEKLYIVGDFIDVWQLRRSKRWPQDHNDVVQKLLRKARKGCPVIYIPGNHDDFCSKYLGTYGNVSIVKQDVHTTADGRRLVVMHGHEFDCVTLHAEWLSRIGDVGYTFLLSINGWLNWCRRLLGRPNWSLSAYIKARVKNAVNFIGNFEKSVSHYAELHSCEGIVCGHIHTPSIRRMQETDYYNTGDWVESCTALVEDYEGNIRLLYWHELSTTSLSFEQEEAESLSEEQIC